MVCSRRPVVIEHTDGINTSEQVLVRGDEIRESD